MFRLIITLASLGAVVHGIVATDVLGRGQRTYELSGPQYSDTNGSIPAFRASCTGTVDQPLKACNLSEVAGAGAGAGAAAVGEGGTSPSSPLVSGNFSTYETSGVGPGLVAIVMTWFSDEYSRNLTLTGSTPLQVNEENNGTWDIYPGGVSAKH
ncbi:hypothetical protein MGN70_006681 [Eutypa lata]|nr:hypothetical protein MGN70_006681 [Eutypa lata]